MWLDRLIEPHDTGIVFPSPDSEPWARVYRADDLVRGGEVAIKVLRPELATASGCPAPLLVHVLRRSLMLAVPLLRLLIGRASYGTDGADRDYEASPDEGEHPKH